MASEDVHTKDEARASAAKGEGFIKLFLLVGFFVVMGFMLLTYAIAGDCAAPSFGPNLDCRPGPLSAPHPGASVYAWAAFAIAGVSLIFGFAAFGILTLRARHRIRKEELRFLRLLPADELEALRSGSVSLPQLLASVQQRVATSQLENLTEQIYEVEQRKQFLQAIAGLNEEQARAVEASWVEKLQEFERRGVRRDLVLLLSGAVLGLPIAWVAHVLFPGG
jgi:hypothetical protein